MKAITVKYLGPTNTKGARVKASSFGHSVTLPWDYEYDGNKNRLLAALSLQSKMNWDYKLVRGALTDDTDVFVQVREK